MTKAKQLMQQSGMIGQPVTVYGEDRAPRRQWLDYFTSVLNSLGFKATEKVVNSGRVLHHHRGPVAQAAGRLG